MAAIFKVNFLWRVVKSEVMAAIFKVNFLWRVVKCEVMAAIFITHFSLIWQKLLSTLTVNVLDCFCCCVLQNVTTVRLKPLCGKWIYYFLFIHNIYLNDDWYMWNISTISTVLAVVFRGSKICIIQSKNTA